MLSKIGYAGDAGVAKFHLGLLGKSNWTAESNNKVLQQKVNDSSPDVEWKQLLIPEVLILSRGPVCDLMKV